uniref:Uncharacterized protein n=1 Tax=Oryza brachyantha TaxID=4533 RepID=J3L158_ORYBR
MDESPMTTVLFGVIPLFEGIMNVLMALFKNELELVVGYTIQLALNRLNWGENTDPIDRFFGAEILHDGVLIRSALVIIAMAKYEWMIDL